MSTMCTLCTQLTHKGELVRRFFSRQKCFQCGTYLTRRRRSNRMCSIMIARFGNAFLAHSFTMKMWVRFFDWKRLWKCNMRIRMHEIHFMPTQTCSRSSFTSFYLQFRVYFDALCISFRGLFMMLNTRCQFNVLYFNPFSQRKISEILHYMAEVWVIFFYGRNSRKKVLKIDLYLEKLWHHNTIFLCSDGISVWWISKLYIFITKYKYKYMWMYVWKFKFGWVGKILNK